MQKCLQKILIATFAVAFFMSCRSEADSVYESPDVEMGKATLKIHGPDGHSLIGDSLQLIFYDEDQRVEEITKIINNEELEIEVERIPQNVSLWVEGLLWNDGVVLYKGGRFITARAGHVTQIELVLVPQFAQIQLAFPLKTYFDYGIKGGSFRAENLTGHYETVLDTTGRPPVFKIQVLPFGQWDVTLRLWDAAGDTLFFADTVMALNTDNAWTHLVLNTSLASARAVFLFDPAPVHFGTLVTMGAVLRDPNPGDLYITEWMANPKVSGNDFEWIEFYNATADTLHLGGCAVRRARTSTAATVAVDFSENSLILPGEWAIMGRDSIPFRAYSQGNFTLSNSGQDVLLLCNEELIDSLSYNQAQAIVGSSHSRIPGSDHFGCTEVDTIPHFPDYKGSPGRGAMCL